MVTSFGHEDYGDRELYEGLYCARGEMENSIKARQLQLFSDRTSTHWMRSNQLRLYSSVFAHISLEIMRRLGLKGTELARARYDTIRLRLLKPGVKIRRSFRRIRLSFPASFPHAELFRQALEKLRAIPLRC